MSAQTKQEIRAFVEDFVVDLTRGSLSIMELLVQESRAREREVRERKRLCAVAVVNNAIDGNYRITRDDIAVFFYNSHLSVKQLADALQIPLSRLKKALKRWYHFF